MNDKDQRINDFLIFFRDIIKENPDYELTMNAIYGKLTYLGIDKSRESIKENFGKWIEYYKNNKECNVYVSPSWQYFCQFISTDYKAQFADEHLKVYIPLDASHIHQGAIQIFDFLSKEKISHLSKIGSHVRFDNIVVRLIDPSDLAKLLDFIKNNQYIQEGLIKANPFTFNQNGIAMAVDGELSYNSTIAELIKIYLINKKKENTIDTVSVNDFYQFIEKYYIYAFNKPDGLEMLKDDFGGIFNPYQIVNYQNVIELIIKSHQINFDFDDYLSHYKECCDSQKQEMKKRAVERLLNGKEQEKTNLDNYREKEEYSFFEKRVICDIQEILDVMTKKYGKMNAIDGLISYIITGDKTYLTRDKGLRERIDSSTFLSDIKEVLKTRGVSVRDYLTIVSDITIGHNEVYLEEAIMETYNKYEAEYQKGNIDCSGKEFVQGSLLQLFNNLSYRGFTRNNNARQKLEDNVSVEDARSIIIKRLGITNNTIGNDAIGMYVGNVLANNQIKRM